jgi:hypothetical protein
MAMNGDDAFEMIRSGGSLTERESLDEDSWQPERIGMRVRVILGIGGLLAACAGVAAVFVTDNELGTAALLLVSLVLVLMSLGALVPRRLKWGNSEVEFGVAASTVQRLLSDPDPTVAETAREALVEEFGRTLTTAPSARQSVEGMVRRFESRIPDLPSRMHDFLIEQGWHPNTPSTATYIRGVYPGRSRRVTLYQNSEALLSGAARDRQFLERLPGARPRGKDVALVYADDLEGVQQAVAAMMRRADSE